MFTPITACRSCDATSFVPVIDLGELPLANDLRLPDDPTRPGRFPLALVCCLQCSLVQLTGTVDREALFDSYLYLSSYSTAMVDAMGALAARMIGERALDGESLVIELASNDGYLLQHYVAAGIRVLGVEPAKNIAEIAAERGIPTLASYFTADVARQLRGEGRRADVVHANNVLAHVPDINDFVEGIAIVLADDGVAVIETPSLTRLIAQSEFDTIYHEHVFYYSLTALEQLFARHGLVVADVELIEMHGGSFRLFVCRSPAERSVEVERVLADEAAVGVHTEAYYRGFSDRVSACRTRTVEMLRDFKARGGRVAGYGAAAKATIRLNYFDIGTDLVERIADRNPHKQGRRVPGVSIPIADTAFLVETVPDYLLILAWNFAEEIMEQQAEYRRAGGTFVLAGPDVRIVA